MGSKTAIVAPVGRGRRRILTIVALAGVVAALVVAAGASGAPKLDKVTLQLGWLPKEEYAFIYAGRDLGFFQRHGIDLRITNGKGSLIAMQTVSGGGADFGYTGGPSFYQAVAAGMSLRMVAVFLQENPVVILSWPNTPVRTIKDIQGKSLILTPGDGFTSVWPAVAKLNDIDRGSVKELAIGVAARAQAFVAHQADAIPYYVTTSIQALEKQANTHFVRLPASQFGADILNNGLFTTNAEIKKKPDLVRRMTAAMVESWNWTTTHAKAAAKIILAQLPGYDLGDVISTVRQTMRLAHTARSKRLPTGCTTLKDWTDSVRIMEMSGQLQRKVPIPQYFTNDFVPGCAKALARQQG